MAWQVCLVNLAMLAHKACQAFVAMKACLVYQDKTAGQVNSAPADRAVCLA